MANPRTTRMALKQDYVHSHGGHNCYDIYLSKRFLWFFWTRFNRAYKHVFAKCKGTAWEKAYAEVYGDFYYGPERIRTNG